VSTILYRTALILVVAQRHGLTVSGGWLACAGELFDEMPQEKRARTDAGGEQDEIPLPIHVKEIRKEFDFDVTTTESPSELEEDLDHLLEITRPGAIVNREVPI